MEKGLPLPQTPPLPPKTFVPVDDGAGQDASRALSTCPPVSRREGASVRRAVPGAGRRGGTPPLWPFAARLLPDARREEALCVRWGAGPRPAHDGVLRPVRTRTTAFACAAGVLPCLCRTDGGQGAFPRPRAGGAIVVHTNAARRRRSEDMKMKKTICLLPGDGIGPEIVAQGVAVLEAVAKKFGHEFDFVPALIGGAAIDATGEPLPAATVDACQKADAVYLGAVGGPKWDGIEPARRPEKGLLGIRKALGLFANLRPALLLPELAGACLLRSDIAARGLDLIVVRELTGDIYFGEPRAIEERNGLRVGYNTMIYDENEIRRIAKVAFETARQRRKKVCSVEKSNVLETSRLWKAVVQEVHADYPDVELSHMYVDNAAMQLVRDPSQFDVILTGNIFGDILSDEASVITGSLGMLPSASMGAQAPALFEPIHGSAPDIAGQDKANPLATILSAGMLLRLAFGLSKEADAVENAVRQTLRDGFRTGDIMEDGCTLVGCAEMGRLVAERL